ncbi:hypothetical protein ACFWYW_14650 [Nonomuraea sp. NPDC059023]|uniref:hypothetical protein n=1 Tax=unclassified Nonomuraea TaxID=2593643 RepID=UPI0036C5C8E6
MTEPSSGLTAAVAELRRLLEVGLTEIRGQLALLLQRAEQAERRQDELTDRVDRHDERLRVLEGAQAARLDAAGSSTRRATWISVVIAACGLAITITLTLLKT